MILYLLYTCCSILFILLSLIIIGSLWIFHLCGIGYGLYKFHRKPSSPSKELPGVSIIKPLTGVDCNLAENLKTFFELDYPTYELLFCVQEPNSEAIDIVKRLQQQYPRIDSQLFIGSQSEKFTIGIEVKNPKIFNMIPAYDKAKHPLFLISDSGLKMHETTLYDMVACMNENVGLVHQMPFTCDRKRFAASVEKVYFGTQHARMYMTINLIGINCVTGMSCLIRKEAIDKVGGLRAFGHYIAEDFYLAYEVAKQGWKIRVAPAPALQNSGEYSIRTWIDRMIRWYKLRMRLSPLAYLEPFQECLSSALLAGIVTNYLFEWNSLVVTACHILIWFMLDYLMLRITQGGPLPFSKFEFAVAWMMREISAFYIYFKAFTESSTIKWRGRVFKLGTGTRAEEIKPLTPFLIQQSPDSSSTTSSTLSLITNSSCSTTDDSKLQSQQLLIV